ncbi:hypothetical protein ABPG72_008203 [Tetrahymena utriculariae]
MVRPSDPSVIYAGWYLDGNLIRQNGQDVACQQGYVKHSNQIGDAGAIEIGTGISYLQNLASLNLGLNNSQIQEVGAKGLLEGLAKSINLVDLKLNLENNLISEEFINSNFGKYICELPKLTGLEFLYNEEQNYLKSKDLVNCKNIKILTIDLKNYGYQIGKKNLQQKAKKILRLVKLITLD